MVSNLRRLVADHADLHNCDLPPNYLFSSSDLHGADDLTQLTVLLTGAYGTPYSAGLWRLHLKIPEDYPQSPPKAAFKTRIWHPNVEESTGAVCVDTLKRDWQPTLTLRDILVTISCLLIHPNPDSALNSSAGALLQDDYEAFARRAKLMTSIHAPIPSDMSGAVMEAKRRGEDPEMAISMEEENRPTAVRNTVRATSLVMKKKPSQTPQDAERIPRNEQEEPMNFSEDEDEDPKENNPSLSPSPVNIPPPSPRKNALGKRPLSVLATPIDPDIAMPDSDGDGHMINGMSASEKNIAANTINTLSSQLSGRKSPKLFSFGSSSSSSITGLQGGPSYEIYEDGHHETPNMQLHRPVSHGKENIEAALRASRSKESGSGVILKSASTSSPSSPTSSFTSGSSMATTKLIAPRKVTKPVSGARKPSSATKATKPRIGVRRL